MFYVLTKHVVRYNAASVGDKYASRHNNVDSWTVNGPFTKRTLAEKAATAAMGGHTCLSAQVVTEEQLSFMSRASSYDQPDHKLSMAISNARKIFLPTTAQAQA